MYQQAGQAVLLGNQADETRVLLGVVVLGHCSLPQDQAMVEALQGSCSR